ncbi:Ni/Fe hydrogenase subunit alpha [Candidatus Pacearchaeota archaeon]|nr:Ni/Fe hydrogenase subunit alpha [Candidatus Pacearchaeota archaeon]
MVREINLNHICKIEGHADLSLKIRKNKVKKCELKASEGARFFEALVLDKDLSDIQEIVSRICGICSCSHTVASIQALEEALNIKPSQQQKYIREILILAERIRSHATHLYFLSLPDFFNASSALSLGKKHKQKINDALEIITLGNKIIEVFGGREIHPFLKIKEELPDKDFSELVRDLENSKKTIKKTIKLFEKLNYPQFERNSDYLSLKEGDIYASISGKITSNTGTFIDDDYKKHIKENIKEYATSKFVLKNENPYMLGAMARINNSHKELDKETQKILYKTLLEMKLKLPLKNPYYNLICQAIEIFASVNRIIKILKEIPEKQKNLDSIKIKSGHGVSSVEAPRGTLFHEYKINKKGKITYCNIITPTAQNLNMMEQDITELVNNLLIKKSSKQEITNKVEKLIRAYDPCFSCSTHFLKVNWL